MSARVGRAVLELTTDQTSFERGLDAVDDRLTKLEQNFRRTGKSADDFGGAARRSKRETDSVGGSLVEAARSAKLMAGQLASELNPALGNIVAGATSAAKGFGSLIGILGVVAVAVGTTLVRSLNDAAQSQAKFNLALRSGDIGALRGDLRAATEELETFAENSKNIAGRIANFFTQMFNPFNDPKMRAGRARAGIEQLTPAETRKENAQGFIALAQTRIQGLEQFASRAAAANDLGDFEKHLAAIAILLDRVAANATIAAEATRDLELMEANTLELGPAAIDRINKRFDVAVENIETQRDVAREALRTRLESGRAEIIPRHRDLTDPVLTGPGPEADIFTSDMARAAQATAEGPMVTLTKSLEAIRRESDLVGDSFDRAAAEFEATKRAILDFNPAVENADERLAALKTRFEELQGLERVKDVFKNAFSAIGQAGSSALQSLIDRTSTVEQAFAQMGRNIAASLLDNVVNKGIKAVQDALFQFLEELQKTGLLKAVLNAIGGAAVGLFGASTNVTPGTNTLGSPGSKASGGLVMSPELSWIGERGPEAVIPLENGSVPVKMQGDWGGGGNVIVNVFNQAPGTDVQQSQQRGNNGELVHNIVIREVRKGLASGELGGDFGSAFGLRRQPVSRG